MFKDWCIIKNKIDFIYQNVLISHKKTQDERKNSI